MFESGRGATNAWGPRSDFRLLAVAAEEPSWITLALELDAAGCSSPRLCWEPTVRSAVARLRDETFDVVVLAVDDDDLRRPVGETVTALRAGASDEPVVVWDPSPPDASFWVAAAEVGFEPLVAPRVWHSKALLPTIGRAVERRELQREHARLVGEQEHRLDRERREAEQLLLQQQRILHDLTESLAGVAHDDTFGKTSAATNVEGNVLQYYQELLRSFVIMGSGRMTAEIRAFAELLVQAGLGAREALELHLDRVDALVAALGNRSTRHVLDRADLLALELVVHVGEHLHRRRNEATAA